MRQVKFFIDYSDYPYIDFKKLKTKRHGPVFPHLYNEFKHYTYKPISHGTKKGEEKNLTQEHCVLIDRIIKLYGNKKAPILSNLTHQEAPWRLAWDNNEDWSKNVIKDEIIKKYFTKNFKKIK
ncbi:Panacea domain-containing protein [Candidatus Phytoplasma gossypii]|uniref:DUF4065 domain-containing protein n=1 Tax=Candidatus Phytoplasma gossypii TaxID=2982629 RepID=A0ABT9D2J6_9MOLU|nr:type II toxin-antitoxin system antitoxin SocA domain-containing protein ['Gossypium sp.' phytoplasma]MDO8057454.1 DUF4065 domain-containing protein ['Gossypium sp.' phytoplasma]